MIVGRMHVVTNFAGNASFTFTGPPTTLGHVVTATAMPSTGSSEFSQAVTITVTPQFAFTASTYAASEGVGNATITVVRTGDTSGTQSVDYATSNNTATAGSDYTATSGTLTFNPGVAALDFTIPILNDTTDEPDELINLTLSNPTNGAALGTSSATLEIADDDAPPTPQFAFFAPTYAVGEGVINATISVVRSGDTSGTQTIDYATSNNTATAGSDYTVTSGTLTFNPGDTGVNFTIPILDDATDETNELINLTLSNPTNGATLGLSSATLELFDDDAPPAITIGDLALAEGNGGTTNFVFNVSIPVASSFAITVDYTTADGTATAGSDYTAAVGTATIPAGSTSTTITVPVTGELLFETDETFTVHLTNPANATIADPQATGTILNDDAAPSITINDVPLNEGDAGTTPFNFTATLSNPSATIITVDYATVNGTATAGSDFTAASGTITFTPGMTTAPVTVNVAGDTLSEPNETFTIALTNPTGGATILDAEGLGTIVNDDGVPAILIGDLAQSEGNGGATLFTFTVTLSEPSASPVTVDFATADGTATAGADYTATSGTLTFIPGDTSETITVTIAGDTLAEGTETFNVNLTNATNAAIGDAQATGTITNDDVAPMLLINDLALAEGNGGTTSFVFTVTLSAPSSATVTVDFATANGTATAGTDYTPVSGTLTFLPGDTSETITVLVAGDTVSEADETFFVNLANATNATIADAQGLGTITNDDAALPEQQIPTLSEWSLIALGALLAALALAKMR